MSKEETKGKPPAPETEKKKEQAEKHPLPDRPATRLNINSEDRECKKHQQ